MSAIMMHPIYDIDELAHDDECAWCGNDLRKGESANELRMVDRKGNIDSYVTCSEQCALELEADIRNERSAL